MRVTRLDDLEAFAREAAPVIERDPAANNLVLGIVQSLLDRPDSYAEASLWVVEHDGEPVAAAIRTPPYNVVLADPLHDDAIDGLVERLTVDEIDLPGVTANTPWVSRFADRWVAATGATARTTIAQGVYTLSSVSMPRPAEGSARPAVPHDRGLLERWMRQFEAEALAAIVRDEHAVARIVARGSTAASRPDSPSGKRAVARSRSADGSVSAAGLASGPCTHPPRSADEATRRTSSPRSVCACSQLAPERASCTRTSGTRRRTGSIGRSATSRSPSR